MKAAPLHISYCGYPNTSGLAQIDFRLTDPMVDPPGMTDHLFTEKLARLPSSFLCYRSFEDGVEVSAPPFRKTGYITFGSFNTGLKVNDDVIEMWVKILHEVENSRLFLKAKHLGDPAIVDAWRAKFSNRGVSADRVILRAQVSSSAEHLMLYHDIDIALDTFPYNGTTTTCEALWMGVPVITLCGGHHAARVGATILNALQLNDWITDSRDGYLRQAVSRAASHQDLEDLRGSLRQRMLSSPLMDEKGFLTDYETLLKRVWREGR